MRPFRAIILSAVLLASVGSAALLFMDRYKAGFDQSADKRIIANQQQAVAKLESAQEELRGMLRQNENMQGALEKDLESEKQRFSGLQQRFLEVISQNKELIHKVDAYKAQEQKELELQKKLQENLEKNQELGRQLMALKKKLEEDKGNSAATAPEANGTASLEIEKKLDWLKTKDELNQAELNRRQEHILALQDRIEKQGEKLSLAMEQFKEMEKDSAMLRERNIALQLERESLMEELNRTRRELSQMQEKLSDIGSLLVAQKAKEAAGQNKPAVQAAAGDDSTGKKVEVDLIGSGGIQGMKK